MNSPQAQFESELTSDDLSAYDSFIAQLQEESAAEDLMEERAIQRLLGDNDAF